MTKQKNQEKYKLYLENEKGNKINLNYSGRVPNIGEKITFDITYTDFKALMIDSKQCSPNNDTIFIKGLNDMFNGKDYVVTKVNSRLELKLNELNLLPYVEAKELQK